MPVPFHGFQAVKTKAVTLALNPILRKAGEKVWAHQQMTKRTKRETADFLQQPLIFAKMRRQTPVILVFPQRWRQKRPQSPRAFD
jgi:hypothetical protein